MAVVDAPHWSWLHGCRKHRGQPAPCLTCLKERDPAITQDGAKMFSAPAQMTPADTGNYPQSPYGHPLYLA